MYIFSLELYVNINKSTHTHTTNFISLAFSETLNENSISWENCLVLVFCFVERKFSEDLK